MFDMEAVMKILLALALLAAPAIAAPDDGMTDAEYKVCAIPFNQLVNVRSFRTSPPDPPSPPGVPRALTPEGKAKLVEKREGRLQDCLATYRAQVAARIAARPPRMELPDDERAACSGELAVYESGDGARDEVDRCLKRARREKAAAAEKAADEARMREHLADAKWMQIALSAWICHNADERKANVAEIATQRKYARVGGVVNLSSLQDLQDEIRAADENIAKARSALSSFRVKPLSCKSPMVFSVLTCVDDDLNDPEPECQAPAMKDFMAVVVGGLRD